MIVVAIRGVVGFSKSDIQYRNIAIVHVELSAKFDKTVFLSENTHDRIPQVDADRSGIDKRIDHWRNGGYFSRVDDFFSSYGVDENYVAFRVGFLYNVCAVESVGFGFIAYVLCACCRILDWVYAPPLCRSRNYKQYSGDNGYYVLCGSAHCCGVSLSSFSVVRKNIFMRSMSKLLTRESVIAIESMRCLV